MVGDLCLRRGVQERTFCILLIISWADGLEPGGLGQVGTVLVTDESANTQKGLHTSCQMGSTSAPRFSPVQVQCHAVQMHGTESTASFSAGFDHCKPG